MTEDALRADLQNLQRSFEYGLKTVREDISAARAEALDGHQRLRDDLTSRLAEAVEAKVRIEVLEGNHRDLVERVESQEAARGEQRRYAIAQLIAAAAVLVAIIALVLKR